MKDLIKFNKIDEIKKLLEYGINLDKLYEGKSLLWLCCYNNKLDILKLLLENGADPNIKNSDFDGETPLICCVNDSRSKSIEMVTILLENDADSNIVDGRGRDALINACSGGKTNSKCAINIDIIKLLINKGANVQYQSSNKYYSCIGSLFYHECGKCDKISIIKLLLYNNININIKDNNGHSPLYKAIKYCNINVINFLIDNEADINIKDKNGDTPFNIACTENNLNVVKLLLSKGYNINTLNYFNQNILFNLRYDSYFDLVVFLLQNGIDINIKNIDNKQIFDLDLSPKIKQLLINFKNNKQDFHIIYEDNEKVNENIPEYSDYLDGISSNLFGNDNGYFKFETDNNNNGVLNIYLRKGKSFKLVRQFDNDGKLRSV